jgi:hypothetical protein
MRVYARLCAFNGVYGRLFASACRRARALDRMRRGSRLLGRLETMRINDLLDLGAA